MPTKPQKCPCCQELLSVCEQCGKFGRVRASVIVEGQDVTLCTACEVETAVRKPNRCPVCHGYQTDERECRPCFEAMAEEQAEREADECAEEEYAQEVARTWG